MPTSLFVDTGAFFAFLNKSDENYPEARKRLLAPGPKITNNYVFDELMTLLASRDQKDLSITFGEQLRSETMMKYHFLTSSEEEKGWQIYKKYKDQDLSFTDCTILTLLKERKGLELLSFDTTLVRIARQIG